MRKKDIATKKYMSDNVRFADVFNYAVYGVCRPGGEKVERKQKKEKTER